MLPGSANSSEHIENPPATTSSLQAVPSSLEDGHSESRRRLVGSDSSAAAVQNDSEKSKSDALGTVLKAKHQLKKQRKDPFRNTHTRNVSLGDKFKLPVKKHSRFYRWAHSPTMLRMELGQMGRSDLAMGFHVLNIGEIGTVSNNFTVDLMVFMVWREDDLMHKTPGWPDVDLDEKSVDIPQVVVVNGVGTPEIGFSRLRPHVWEDPSCPFVRLQQKMSIRCHEILEVHDFPLDMQELTVTFYFPALFARDRTRDPTIYPLQVNGRHPIVWKSGQRFLSEWRLRQPVLRAVTSQHIRFGKKRPKPELYLTFHVERAAKYYVSNYMLILFALTTLSITTLWIDFMDIGQRLEVNFTIVLTSCTMKFLVADQLPKVPYFTSIDYYMVVCIFFLFFLLVENTVVAAIGQKMGEEKGKQADTIGMYVWLGTWFSYIIGQLIWFRRKAQKNAKFFPAIAEPGGHVRQTDVSGGIFYRCELDGEDKVHLKEDDEFASMESLRVSDDVATISEETTLPFNKTIG